MTSAYEKTRHPANEVGESNIPHFYWARSAAIVATALFVLSSLWLSNIIDSLPDRPLFLLWLGLLPIHGAAPVGVLLVLYSHVPAGSRVAALGLQLSGLSWLGQLVSRKVLFVMLIYIISMLITLVTTAILFFFDYQPSAMPLLELLLEDPSLALIMSVFTAAVLIAPVSEEILFRVVLFDALQPLGTMIASIIAAIVFALAHGSPAHLPALFFLGLTLQWLRLRTGGLWACIFCHMGFNLFTFILLGLWLWAS